MAYTKNHDPWTASDPVSTTVLDNFETIYTEAASYLSSHTHDSSYYTESEMQSTFWYSGNDGSGSGADADLIYYSTGNMHASDFAGLGVPTGLVVMWSGSIASIPSGWALCDGSGGTIDLTDSFVLGAGSTYSPGDTGGSTTFTAAGTLTVNAHVLTTSEIPAHHHPFVDRYAGPYWTGGGGSAVCQSAYAYTGTTATAGGSTGHGHSSEEGTSCSVDAVACMPYYYALAFIQKT